MAIKFEKKIIQGSLDGFMVVGELINLNKDLESEAYLVNCRMAIQTMAR